MFFNITFTFVIIVSANSFFIIPTGIFCIILVVLRRYVLRTTRNLKRLDAQTKSPIVGQINSTMQGLTTIRVCRAEATLSKEFDQHLDIHSSATYMFQSCIRAFNFFMDICCICFSASAMFKFLWNSEGALSGTVGLVLSQTIMLTSVIEVIFLYWAQLENQMTSVERSLEYTELKPENNEGQCIENFPTEGCITYENVSLSYGKSTNDVLKKINFTVGAGEKVAIVGRTGAGKSSLVSALFRLHDFDGRIMVDGHDTKTISLKCLRSNILLISQDAVLFPGTVRSNIDPEGKYSDDEIWSALERVDLVKLFPNLSEKIVKSGDNISMGQRQLLFIARALVRKRKILVTDEATANVDPVTDNLIQMIFKDDFAGCTVLAISHNVNNALEYDRVMVLDDGRIVEFDKPSNLVKKTNGAFYLMLQREKCLSGNLQSEY